MFGIPDERLGEVVCAAIKITSKSNLDEDSVKAYCNGNVSICEQCFIGRLNETNFILY